MQAIIRLKRPLDDSPSDTLILNCSKKRKLDEATTNQVDEPLFTILKFTGTQNTQDEDVTKYVSQCGESLKERLSLDFKKHQVNLNKKLRQEAQEISKINRYKVVNCLRSNVEASSCNDKKLTVYDLELGNDETDINSEKHFVFDLYYANTDVLDEVEDYNVSIFPTTESLIFDSDDVYNLDDENADSEDSNAENNWRNDYPDESDVDSINENDIIDAMKNVELEDSLSSEEEVAYYTESCEDYDFDIDEIEEKKYGKMYAKFKAKYNGESSEDSSLSDIVENENDLSL